MEPPADIFAFLIFTNTLHGSMPVELPAEICVFYFRAYLPVHVKCEILRHAKISDYTVVYRS